MSPPGPVPPPRWGRGAPTGAGSGPTGPIPLPPPPRHRPMVLVAPCRAISRYIAAYRGPAPPFVTVSGSRASARARAAEGRLPPPPRAPRLAIGCRGLSLSPRDVYGSAGRSWGGRGCHVVCPGFAGWRAEVESRRSRVRVLPRRRAGPGFAVLLALRSLPSKRG